jgi:hypothetical protein
MSELDLIKTIREQLEKLKDDQPLTIRSDLLKQMFDSFLEMNDERVGWEHLCLFLFKKCQFLSYVHAGDTPDQCNKLECLRCKGIGMTYDPEENYANE